MRLKNSGISLTGKHGCQIHIQVLHPLLMYMDYDLYNLRQLQNQILAFQVLMLGLLFLKYPLQQFL